MAVPLIVALSTYRFRSVEAEPPYASLRKLTLTVWVPEPKVPFTVKTWSWPEACAASAVWVPPICCPSTEMVKVALPW